MTPPRFGQPPAIRTQLSHWNDVIDGRLAASRAEDALPLIRVILTSLPRHLPTYFRLLQVAWLMRRWHEGREWALRLLSADPGSELAWAVLARCAEADGELALAQRYWTLALENAPYNRPIRQGLSRTLLRQKRPLMLTRPALATLYRMGGRWERAIRIYAELTEEEPGRLDFRSNLLEATWHCGQTEEALHLARYLVSLNPNLLLGWVVSARIGDEDDKALARAPLVALDPDGGVCHHTLRRQERLRHPYRHLRLAGRRGPVKRSKEILVAALLACRNLPRFQQYRHPTIFLSKRKLCGTLLQRRGGWDCVC